MSSIPSLIHAFSELVVVQIAKMFHLQQNAGGEPPLPPADPHKPKDGRWGRSAPALGYAFLWYSMRC